MSKIITPEQYALTNSETSHQIALFIWIASPETKEQYPHLYPDINFLFAIPNGEFRNMATAVRLKAMGVKRGVLDLMLPVPRGPYHGLWVEMKRPKNNGKREGQLSNEQKDVWIPFLIKQGYAIAVCKTWQEAKDNLIGYLEYKG